MAKKKKSGSKGGASGGTKKRELVRTPFMEQFTRKFIGQPNHFLWPKPGTARDDVVKEFQAIANVLLAAGYGVPVPTGMGSPGDDVAAFLNDMSWPKDPTGIPKKYLNSQTTVRLVEVAVILDRLLRAINRYKAGIGGGGGGWPPH